MVDRGHFENWRALLKSVLGKTQEKQRIADILGVTPVTLTRWLNGDAKPRPQSLLPLLNVLPEHRAALLPLLRAEYGEALDELGLADDTPEEIPSNFYQRVFQAYGELQPPMRSWSIGDLILQQALRQLDPGRVGLEITVVRCMYNTKKRVVRSLRETMGRGTPPWSSELQRPPMLLGAESLVGYIVTSGHPLAVQNAEGEQSPYPVRWMEGERSAAGHPITRGMGIAGCLHVSCTQPNYFTPARQALIRSYAELMVLAFEPDEFYQHEDIQLYVMPSYEVQKKAFATFRQRVSQVLIQAAREHIRMDIVQAEQLVWQQIEDELLAAESF
jgi:transcriptional regulator with XRE-family HTH domain